METDASVKELKEICKTYLKRFNNRRKFCTQISNAIDKDNSKTIDYNAIKINNVHINDSEKELNDDEYKDIKNKENIETVKISLNDEQKKI